MVRSSLRQLINFLALSTTTVMCFAFIPRSTIIRHHHHHRTTLLLQNADGISADDETNHNNNNTVVTREMFLRDMLRTDDDDDNDDENDNDQVTPIVKRPSKKRRYKVLDNRDSLPFSVMITTPDPYTHPEQKKQQAVKSTKTRKDTIEAGLVSSRLLATDDDDENLKTVLGEFMLDKHTTTGDVLQIGELEYRVVRHRCQYKYAGGQRFVMVRKILEVKEVGRLQAEEYIRRQWNSPNGKELSD